MPQLHQLATPLVISLFLLFGAAVGAIFWYVANKKFRQMEKQARDTLHDIIRDKDVRIAQIDAERQEYKAKSHTLRNDCQGYQLEIAELKTRPDFTSLMTLEKEWHSQRVAFYSKLFRTMERINDKLDINRESIRRSGVLCNEVAVGLVGLVKMLAKQGVVPADYELDLDTVRQQLTEHETQSTEPEPEEEPE